MKKLRYKKTIQLVLAAVFISLYAGFAYTVANIYTADVCNEKAVNLADRGAYYAALNKAECAVNKNDHEPNYYRNRAKILILLAATSEDSDISDYKKAALFDLIAAYNLNPKNLVTLRNSVPLYYYLAIRDYSLPPGINNQDSEYIGITKEFFTTIKNRYSGDAGVVVLLAKYEKKLGLTKEYEESVEIIKKLRPDLLDWHEAFF